MPRCCYECGKAIQGKMILTNPSLLMIRLALDFPKAYHVGCYAKAEQAAELELNP